MTGDPARPANGGPWPDGGDWVCHFDFGDPYMALWWSVLRGGVDRIVWRRIDGIDSGGQLKAVWQGSWRVVAGAAAVPFEVRVQY